MEPNTLRLVAFLLTLNDWHIPDIENELGVQFTKEEREAILAYYSLKDFRLSRVTHHEEI